MTRLEEMIENLKSSRKALKKAAKAAERPEPVKRLSKTAAKDATIARLRAALENARDKFEAIRYDGEYHASHETMVACRDAVDRIDAALAKARQT